MGRPCLQWLGLRLPRVNNHRHSLRVYRHPIYQGCCASGSITLQSRSFGQSSSRATESKGRGLFIKSPEVATAIRSYQPVVALETTIYTHGFPYPDNVELALELEDIVRSNGGVPATIGILEGVARVGLNKEQLIAIASSAGKPETMKVSRRDLPYILGLGVAGRKLNGGTTIAGTMFIAHRAGIKVFGTGGLGGVHRGGQDTMDISADLTELGRTMVAVVSSGCKSFLDIPRTLEYLETQGAGVFTFADGRTGDIDFPAFFTRDSGVKSPMVIQNEKEAAAIIYTQRIFPGCSGLLFANPIPEEFSIPKAEIDIAIDQAVQEAADQGFHGHANTPFILSRIKELTKGNSLPANRALVKSNVAMATKVAVELSKLEKSLRDRKGQRNQTDENGNVIVQTSTFTPVVLSHSFTRPSKDSACIENSPAIVVFGSVAMDLACDYAPRSESSNVVSLSKGSNMEQPQMHTSNIAVIHPSLGGVGHNVALAAQLAGGKVPVRLCSFVAEDLAGNTIIAALKQEGMSTLGIRVQKAGGDSQSRTAQYVAVNDAKKDLVIAMADMSIFDQEGKIPALSEHISPALKWIVVDANWRRSTIRSIMSQAKSSKLSVAFEPVSVAKSAALFQPSGSGTENHIQAFPKHIVDLATPNQHELAAMHASAKKHDLFESERWWQVIDALGIPGSGARDRFVSLTNKKMTDDGIPLQTIQLLPFIPTILTKLGANGVLLTKLLKTDDPDLTDPDSTPYILCRNSNGSTEVGGVYMRLFPALETVEDVVSVNGVGDTFLGVLVAGLAKGLKLDERLVDIAQRGAILTLRSKEAVSPDLGILSKSLDELV